MPARSSRLPLVLVTSVAVLALAGAAVMLFLDEEPPAEPVDPAPVVQPEEAPDRAQPDLPAGIADRDPEPPPPEPAPTAVIRGRLVNPQRMSLSGGRVRAATGVPALVDGAPAQVTLLPVAAAPVQSDGRFSLAGLPGVDDLMLVLDQGPFVSTEVGPYRTRLDEETDLGDVIIDVGLTVRGTVRSRDGRMLPGAEVGLYSAFELTAAHERPSPRRVETTDEDGRFLMEHVPRRMYQLQASADGYGVTSYQGGAMPGEVVGEQEVVLVLDTARVLSGRVVSQEDEEPIAGATIRAIGYSKTPGLSHATTDEDGVFRFDDLRLGSWALTATSPGFNKAEKQVGKLTFDEMQEFALSPTGRIRGAVFTPEGEPVKAYDLRLRYGTDKAGSGTPTGRLSRVRDSNGAFEVDDLQKGWYRLEVWAKGYALTTSEPVRMTAGREVEGVGITLQRGSQLTGQVVDDRGDPVVGAAVSLHRNRLANIPFFRAREWREPWQRTVYTDTEGWYTFRDLVAGLHQIQVDHGEHPVTLVDDVQTKAGEVTTVDAVVLQRTATIVGVASDPRGQTLARATVSLGGPVTLTTRTDNDGRYRFERLPPGTYYLECMRDDKVDFDFRAQIDRGLAMVPIELTAGEVRETTVVSN